jgi:hypothetical protein
MIAGNAIDQIRRFNDGWPACPGMAAPEMLDKAAVSCGKSDDDIAGIAPRNHPHYRG